MALYDIKGVKEIAGGIYEEILLQNEFVKLDQTTPQTIANGQPIQGSLTASQLVATDASKKLQSLAVATYPSLTELSYIKGLSSAVQTQLNGKQATLTNPVTGTGTANEISYWTGAGTQGTLAVATYPSLTELSYVKGATSSIQTQLGTKAASSHTHGNITNAGAIGSTASLPIITTTSGVLTTGTFGTAAGSFCQGNDSRLSDARTPTSHTLVSHTATGLTTGHFLKATGATTFGFAAHGLTASDVGAAPTTSPTFATSITGSYLTASEMLITNASKQIISAPVATYPSLTELAFVKGVTSNIQTQLNAKGAGTVTSVTGTAPITSSGGTTPAISISAATTSAAGSMSAADKTKLDGIAASANNYTHPANHAPSIITQDASNRFVTDSEKTTWNAKASTAVATTSVNGLMASTDKSKLDGVAANATANAGTVTSVAAITLGTTGTDVSSTVANGSTTPVITLNIPTASSANRGVLSAADWSTFNGKQAALGFTPYNATNPNNYIAISAVTDSVVTGKVLTSYAVGTNTALAATDTILEAMGKIQGQLNSKGTSSLRLGTNSTDAFRGDYGNTAYSHSQAAHAPSNAQKNSDITKAEIEAKLTGVVSSHEHKVTFNTQTGTTYTLVLSDVGKLIRVNNAGAITLTIPTNATVGFDIGTVITIEQSGAGVITIAPASGVTINSSARKTWSQDCVIQIYKIDTDIWNVIGGIV